MTGPEQHAATLRGMAAYVPVEDHYGTHPRQAYDAALDELVALAGRADELRETLRKVQTYAATNTDDELYAFVTAALAGVQADNKPASPPARGTDWNPDHPAYDEMGQ